MTKLLCVCLFVVSMAVFSQEKTKVYDIKNELLVDIIPIIENTYAIKFSYLDITLSNKFVSAQFTSETSFTELLRSFEEQTQLKFEKTGDNFISIRTYNNTDTIHICGYILDENEKPLENIRVFIKSSKINLVTGANGYFENKEVPFSSAILISADGFRQKVVTASSLLNKQCSRIYIKNTVEELNPVVIREYLTRGITLDKKVINIKLNDIAILPGLTEPDILQSIQLAPGVNSPFETVSGIYVRGSVPSQNLVLWNGIKTYHQGHLFGMLSAFNPYAVKEVDFHKSGISARYGDRIAGVIDIKTDNEVAKHFTGNTGFNMINTDAVIHTPIIKDKVSLQLSGRRSYTDILETFTYKQFSDRVFQNISITENSTGTEVKNDFFFMDYNAKLIADISDADKIEINALYNKNDLNYKKNDGITSLNDDLITENEGYNISWNHIWNRKLVQYTNSYYSKYLLNYQFKTGISGTTTEIESKKNQIKDIGAKLELHYALTDHQKIIGGYQYSNNAIKYAFITTTPDYELILDQDDRLLNTHALFTEYRFETFNNLYLSAGIRWNQYVGVSKAFIEPRIFIQKNLSPVWKISATGEFRSQAVSQIKESVISDLPLENQVWTLADEEKFPVITSYQATLGSSFRKNKWHFDIDGYYKKINNITSLTAGFINPVDNNYHLGESNIYGIDFFLKKRFKKYKTWVSYSYINTQNTFENINDNKSFPGNWNIEHTIKWSHFYKIQNFQFSLGWIWHTGKSYTNISNISTDGNLILLDYDQINGNNLPVYHRLDFSTIYDFKIKSNPRLTYRLGLSVVNLYGRKNLLNREFRTTNSLDNQLINRDIFALGVTPNISFRVFW
ncbi:TonB-dependent receptor [Aquimarina addita]|uniref:TonB-dependent receptor n=1 Tax=Aquimarina addita TaxID=870485 RepID=A0ABP7X7H4_9FLAO